MNFGIRGQKINIMIHYSTSDPEKSAKGQLESKALL